MRLTKTIAMGVSATVLAGALFTMSATANAAEEWPKKPITVIVGFSAGGGTDTYARVLASVIPPFINNQPLIIVNKTGGAQVPPSATL